MKRPARVVPTFAPPGAKLPAPACADCTRRKQKQLRSDHALSFAEARERALEESRMVRVGDGWLCASCTQVPIKPDGITEISVPLSIALPNREHRRATGQRTPANKRRQIVAKAALAAQQAEAEMKKPRSQITIARALDLIELPKGVRAADLPAAPPKGGRR